jgi:hypothetical protein
MGWLTILKRLAFTSLDGIGETNRTPCLTAILIAVAAASTAQTIYITGTTTSTSYPVTNGSKSFNAPRQNGVVTFLSVQKKQTTLAFSTYLGGGNSGAGVTQLRVIWVDPLTRDVLVGGRTSQDTKFAISGNVFQRRHAGGADDAIICRFSSAGVQRWCSNLGTNGTEPEETVYGIAGIDGNGYVTVCGRMNSMPGQNTIDGVLWRKIGPVPPRQDTGYIAKIKGDGSGLVWFTSFGGSGTGDGIRGRCTLDTAGNVYAGGETGSLDFPVTANAFQKVNKSPQSIPRQGTVVAMKADGSDLLWASYLGGTSQTQLEGAVGGIALDKEGNVMICGMTSSTDLFPNGTPGYQTKFVSPPGNSTIDGRSNVSSEYVAKIKADGTKILAGTYLGGNQGQHVIQNNECDALALDQHGNVIIMGETFDTNFPTTPGAFQKTNHGRQDGVISKFSPDLATLIASTYVGGSGLDAEDHSGGIGLDPDGNVYAIIGTNSNDFPVSPNGYQTTYIGNGDSRNIAIFGLNPDFSSLVYGTYLGAPVTANDRNGTWPWGLAVK